MAIFRQYIAPLIVVLIFVLSLVAVSARIFLPQDMAAPAPIEEFDSSITPAPAAELPSSLKILVQGTPDDLGMVAPW
ncbi:MAG: hypothetical protein HC881_01700 [Leptolyngbyaceae cyanobacterium SL_7_1]|nr:hypothetical protein [Leptolyngbyaceae cyanobacterium SL_7_1]